MNEALTMKKCDENYENYKRRKFRNGQKERDKEIKIKL